MEVDEIQIQRQQQQVCKFQRVSSNGSTTTTDKIHDSSDLDLRGGVGGIDAVVGGGGGGGNGGGNGDGDGGVAARLCGGWPSSRIVRVSRASGGKDRHSKVLTSKGLRDRRVRLSVSTAIQFYDLQDRLGYDQPSKAVEWLLKAASGSIEELPSLDPSFSGVISHGYHRGSQEKKSAENSTEFEDPSYNNNNNNNNNSVSKSPACSSTSETSKGSGLSLSRSENRAKARERAREMASKKEKDKETDSSSAARVSVSVLNHQVNNISENSSFTDLLTGGINNSAGRRPDRPASPEPGARWTTPMDYFFTRSPQPPPNHLIQMPPQFNINNNQHHHQQHHFSFLQDGFVPAAVTTGGSGGGGGGESYNLNFSMTSSSSGGAALASGFSRGTLQSNLPSSLLAHHHHHVQRFQSSSVDGSTPSNLPFFIVPSAASDHFPMTGGYGAEGLHRSYGGGDGVGRNSDHQSKKAKN